MNCTDCQELLAGHLEEVLSDSEQQSLNEHLTACPECRKSLTETRQLVDRLVSDADDSPTSSCSERVMDRIMQEQSRRLGRTGIVKPISKIVTAATLLIALYLIFGRVKPSSNSSAAYADELRLARTQGEQVQTATWKLSFYQNFVSADGRKTKWVRIANNNNECFFRAPGHYRYETRDETGQLLHITIKDMTSRTQLLLDPTKKVASTRSINDPDYRGPFSTALGTLQQPNLQFLGKRQIAKREAFGFRHAFHTQPENQKWSYDIWIDAKSKQLMQSQVPGEDLFNPADLVDFAKPGTTDTIELAGTTYQRSHTGLGGGHLFQEITFNPPLDPALFSLKVPDGYQSNDVPRVAIRETDILEFLPVVAGYFGGKFPDALPGFYNNAVEHEWYQKLVEAHDSGKGKLTPAEKKMMDTRRHWLEAGFPGPGPLPWFIDELTVPGTWKYLGRDVRLGDKTRIICWYQLLGKPNYRVIYGDLSIKDAKPDELPLPVQKSERGKEH